jgi:calcineurin-like phosphoesterase family protein
MATFFTSDQHFGHHRILELGEGRPFRNIDEHNGFIVKQWVENVQHDDVVYVLGDIALGGYDDFIKNVNIFSWLPGVKYLVPGNHDKIWSGNTDKYRERYKTIYEDAGFIVLPEQHVIDFMLDDNKSVEIMLSHIPYRTVSKNPNDDRGRADKFKNQTPVDEGLPLIHGHTHLRFMTHEHKKSLHVGVDATGFKPVSDVQVREWLSGVLL